MIYLKSKIGCSFWDYNINATLNIGNFSVGGSIGTSGIGFSFSFTKDNTTHTIGATIGWGTLAAVTALVLSPIPGSKIVAALTLLFGWLF